MKLCCTCRKTRRFLTLRLTDPLILNFFLFYSIHPLPWRSIDPVPCCLLFYFTSAINPYPHPSFPSTPRLPLEFPQLRSFSIHRRTASITFPFWYCKLLTIALHPTTPVTIWVQPVELGFFFSLFLKIGNEEWKTFLAGWNLKICCWVRSQHSTNRDGGSRGWEMHGFITGASWTSWILLWPSTLWSPNVSQR